MVPPPTNRDEDINRDEDAEIKELTGWGMGIYNGGQLH